MIELLVLSSSRTLEQSMQYKVFLQQQHECPFCTPQQQTRSILESRLSFLTYNIAPYHAHHLLVIPKRHYEHILDLTQAEQRDVLGLIDRGMKLLQALGYPDITLLLREGEHSGKSVKHLHYHLIPKILIGDVQHDGGSRSVLTEKQVLHLKQELQEAAKDL